MGVLAVNRVPFGNKSGVTLGSDNLPIYTFTDHWQVEIESIFDLTEITCLLVDGLPVIGETGVAPGTGIMYVTEANAIRSEESPILFDVYYTWKTIHTDLPKWDVNVAVRGVERTEDAHVDGVGNPISSSAGEPFDPSIKHTYYDEEISVQYKSLTVDGDMIASLRGCVSTEDITLTLTNYSGYTRTWPAGTIKLAKVDYNCVYGEGPLYFSVSIILHYKSQIALNTYYGDGSGPVDDGTEMGWYNLIVDKGHYFIQTNPLTGDPDRGIKPDVTQSPLTGQYYLNGSGYPVNPGVDPTCVLLAYMEEDQADLTPLLADIG